MPNQTPAKFSRPKQPLSVLAASYSCIVPFITAGMTFLLVLYILDDCPTLTRQAYVKILLVPLGMFVSTLIAGIVSLFGMQRHGATLILPRAIIGIVGSLGFGIGVLLLMTFSSLIR
jgi:hypothetical protein